MTVESTKIQGDRFPHIRFICVGQRSTLQTESDRVPTALSKPRSPSVLCQCCVPFLSCLCNIVTHTHSQAHRGGEKAKSSTTYTFI